ncbi:MAG: DUF5615 family PIN-like protein [Acidimicrobiales bacterium]
MKLLFDQNLSRHLVARLSDVFPNSTHVLALALDTAADNEIWSYAGQHGYTIVSKDSDFRQLAFLLGPPPKAVWLRLGNATTNDIAEVLRERRDLIAEFGTTENESLLILTRLTSEPG